MCKFTNKLFAISVLLLVATRSSQASPLSFLFDYLDDSSRSGDDGNYDLTYDQRQNGTENVRLNLDGVLIAVPSSGGSSSSSSNSFTDIASNLLLTTLLGGDYDDKSADITAEEGPIGSEADTKQKEPIQAEKDDEKKPQGLKDVSIEEKKGETEVVLLRTNAKVNTPAAAGEDDEEDVPKKIHLRRRNK